MSPSTSVTFVELVESLKKIPMDEIRRQEADYFEFVLKSALLVRVYPLLEGFYGVPFKPAGVAASSKAQSVALRYGGIQKQQTLYYVDRGDFSDCAMIWPWNDGAHVTVKMARGRVGEGS